MSETLRPRFLPDGQAQTEWGESGAAIARLVRAGFRVPPTAAFGLTQVEEWLRSVGAREAGGGLAEDAASRVAQAPMPEHFPLSFGTLRKLLTGDEPWPLSVRAAVTPEYVEPRTSGLSATVADTATADDLWAAFRGAVAAALTPAALKRAREAGVEPSDYRLNVLAQPKLHPKLEGYAATPRGGKALSVEWREESGGEIVLQQTIEPTEELSPFWADLERSLRQAEGIIDGPARLDWSWDGEQLWFTRARAHQILGPLQFLLVDLDGTLLDASQMRVQMDFIRRSLREFRAHGGLLKAMKALRAVDSELKRRGTGRELTNDKRAARVFADALGLDTETGERALAKAMADVFPSLERHFWPIPGAREFLEWAKDQFPLVLATNPVWDEELIRLRLKWAGIDPEIFLTITHARSMHACKPDPEYYQELLDQLGANPEECLLVGNEVKMDLPATRVGIPVYIVRPPAKRETARAKKRTGDGAAVPSWQGTFAGLRRLLEERHVT